MNAVTNVDQHGIGDPLEVMNFWYCAESGCGSKSSFSLTLTLADRNFFTIY